MFYSLEEAAARLGKSADDVKAMADRRELEVFRDRDRIMFKVEQIELLAGGKSGDEVIPLAESGELEPISLASSGSGAGIADNPKEQTGISIFDADSTEEADSSAVTRVTPSPTSFSTGDSSKSGSGSGLYDLTRDIDETAVGMTNLEEAYAGVGSADESAPGSGGMDTASSGALFESPAAEPASAFPAMAAFAEPYDGPGSGLVGGFALGALVALALTAFAILLVLTGMSTSEGPLKILADNLWAVVGGVAGFAVLCGIVGWLLGKRS